jgi:AraC-like DNA-binding protein
MNRGQRSESRVRFSAGGRGAFRWSPAAGGIFAFDATGLRTSHGPHLHAWYCIYVVTQGAVMVRRGDQVAVATPGMVVLLAPYETHEEHYDPGTGCSYHGLYPTANRVRLVLRRDDAREQAPFVFPRAVVDDPRLAALLLATRESLETSNTECQEQLLSATLRVVGDRHAEEPRPDRSSRNAPAVHRAREFILSARDERASVDDVARAAGLSRYHLSRVFREVTGLAPYAFFEKVRLARAHLLIHSGVPLSRVAATSGFSDQSHLTRHFAAQVGTTPGTYARAVREAMRGGRVARISEL